MSWLIVSPLPSFSGMGCLNRNLCAPSLVPRRRGYQPGVVPRRQQSPGRYAISCFPVSGSELGRPRAETLWLQAWSLSLCLYLRVWEAQMWTCERWPTLSGRCQVRRRGTLTGLGPPCMAPHLCSPPDVALL